MYGDKYIRRKPLLQSMPYTYSLALPPQIKTIMRYHVKPVWMAFIKKRQVSASIQSKENPFILLLGMTNGTATMENNMEDFPGGPVVKNSCTSAGFIVLLLVCCVMLGKSLNHSESSYPH